jgi:hypothetical protein
MSSAESVIQERVGHLHGHALGNAGASPVAHGGVARDPPAGEVRELRGWMDRRQKASEDAIDLLTVEEARPRPVPPTVPLAA